MSRNTFAKIVATANMIFWIGVVLLPIFWLVFYALLFKGLDIIGIMLSVFVLVFIPLCALAEILIWRRRMREISLRSSADRASAS